MPPHCDTLDGPVVNAARRALDGDDVEQVRLAHLRELRPAAGAGVAAARAYTSATLSFVVWSHKLWRSIRPAANGH